MYQMTYYSDYGFDKFLEEGAETDYELQDFLQGQLGVEVEFLPSQGGCTAFITKNEKGEVIYGRNYDFPPTNVLQLKTTPENGYASVSTVDLQFIGFAKEKSAPTKDSKAMLCAPFVPFDGMDEGSYDAQWSVMYNLTTLKGTARTI